MSAMFSGTPGGPKFIARSLAISLSKFCVNFLETKIFQFPRLFWRGKKDRRLAPGGLALKT
jgi:hypothetical protein